MRFIAVVFALLLPVLGISQNEDLFDYVHSLKYAEYLFNSHQYQEAAQEYERVLFFQNDDLDIQHRLLTAYLRSHAYEIGIRRTWSLYPDLQKIPTGLAFTYGKLLLMEHRSDSLQLLLTHPEIPLKERDRAFLGIGDALFNQQWKQAQSIYEAKKADIPSVLIFGPAIEKTYTLKKKSPVLAMALSTVVPGSGRFYTKQWKDGLISMILIGGLSYTVYRNFSRENGSRTLGFIYAGLGVAFYGGNVYGSFQSAKRYNKLRSHEIIDDSNHIIRQHL